MSSMHTRSRKSHPERFLGAETPRAAPKNETSACSSADLGAAGHTRAHVKSVNGIWHSVPKERSWEEKMQHTHTHPPMRYPKVLALVNAPAAEQAHTQHTHPARARREARRTYSCRHTKRKSCSTNACAKMPQICASSKQWHSP